LDENINIKEGVKYLAKMKKECKYNNNNEWVICYNVGKNYKKTINHPELFPYVKRINIAMENN
jgi:hypothetical protein